MCLKDWIKFVVLGLAWGSSFVWIKVALVEIGPFMLGVLGTSIAYLLYYSLNHSVGPTRTMLVTYVFPLVGVALGVGFLDEVLIWQELVGGLLIISGIVIVNSRLSLPNLLKRS